MEHPPTTAPNDSAPPTVSRTQPTVSRTQPTVSRTPSAVLVWFKRDLRLSDHEPLRRAIETGLPVLLLHCFEPGWIAGGDSDLRHWRFVYESVQSMQAQLQPLGATLYSLRGEVLDVLEALRSQVDLKAIFSHEETGNGWTYDRDRAVAAFCLQQGIAWHETPTGGVWRRLYHRKDWEKKFVERMEQPAQHPDLQRLTTVELPADLVSRFSASTLTAQLGVPDNRFQPGGEMPARRYLHSFLYERSRSYFRHISKPEEARRSCSRISPYLTWGNVSQRQVWQATSAAIEQTGDRYNLGQFRSRLFWHCHFVQKLETECRMEFENLNRGFDLIRTEVDPERVAAWQTGTTGIPMIDACMRCVTATGYLNFRMRSMLVSFLTHHLWQPWQAGAHHLARQFLDYEPGIHYAQFQMQAGTMGVNTFRIYNPVKQSQEHDPEAVFLKKWLPELAHLPTQFIHAPWQMTPLEQQLYGYQPGATYPQPIVDLERSGAQARERLWQHKKHPLVQAENARILQVHTKRRDAEETSVMGDPRTVARLTRKA